MPGPAGFRCGVGEAHQLVDINVEDAAGALAMIEAVRAQTNRAFNVNVFVHAPARGDAARPARCLANRFTQWSADMLCDAPDYPIAYDAGKALNAAAKAAGEGGFGVQWAGQGASLHRVMPAGRLVELLWQEASHTA